MLQQNNQTTPLLDADFLKLLFNDRNRETYIKIISYSLANEPIEEISGRATGGSVNIDGASSVRRSCSLTLVADLEDSTFHDYYWSLSTQFEMFVGIKNKINPIYDDIIWFPMGFYLISSFNCTKDTTKYTISIQGKDKMCKLNGELGGTFTALTTDLAQVDTIQADGSILTEQLTIKDIIFNLVNQYGQEDYHNIIIKDLPNEGSSLLEYRGSSPLYIFKDLAGNCLDYKTDGTIQIMIKDTEEICPLNSYKLVVEKPSQKSEFKKNPTIIYPLINNIPQRDKEYTLMKLEYGEAAGYSPTSLTYPGKLVANLGEKVTTVLDKIKQMLVNFEYFYNEYGQFVFQQKKTTLTASLGAFQQDGNGVKYIAPTIQDYRSMWSFDDNQLITNMTATKPINNIKNDYCVWGKNGNKPIHLRYSINDKPSYYKNYNNEEFAVDLSLYEDTEKTHYVYDWREILYQMAKDKMKYGQKIDFRRKLIQNHATKKIYQSGFTGYETYYADMEAFWRLLYDPNPPPLYEQVAFNETDEQYDNRYVDAFVPYVNIASTDRLALNKEDFYITITDESEKQQRGLTKNQMQRWVDTIDLLGLRSWHGFYGYVTRTSATGISYKELVFKANKKDLFEQAGIAEDQAKEGYIYTQSVDSTLAGDFASKEQRDSLNRLYFQQGGSYVRLIDSIDLAKTPVYVLQENETVIDKDNVIFIVERLTEDMQDHVYMSEKIGGALTKYLDGYPVTGYRGLSHELELFSNNFWVTGPQHSTPLQVYEIYFNFSDIDKALIWQAQPYNPISLTEIDFMAEASSGHIDKLQVRAVGHPELISLTKDDIISVRARRADKNLYLWYKENADSEPEPLYEKILTYDETDWANNKISKYDILLQRLDAYYPMIELIDIDKSQLYIQQTDEEHYRLIDMCFPSVSEVNRIYIKTNEKIDFREISEPLKQYFYTSSEESKELQTVQNSAFIQYLTKEKLNLRGRVSTSSPVQNIDVLIKYYFQYYEFFLPVDKNNYIDATQCWNRQAWHNFSIAPFWIEFLPSGTELSHNSVTKIGLRQKTENNTKVTGIDFGAIPNIQFVSELPSANNRQAGYTYILITEGVNTLFSVGAQGKSCIETVNEWLTSYAMLQQNVTITAVPLYHLSPNTLLSIVNPELDINGNFEITKITLPLTYNGTMSITAKEILESI